MRKFKVSHKYYTYSHTHHFTDSSYFGQIYMIFHSLFAYIHNLSEFSNSGYLQRKSFHKKKKMNLSKIKNVKKEMINVCVRSIFNKTSQFFF